MVNLMVLAAEVDEAGLELGEDAGLDEVAAPLWDTTALDTGTFETEIEALPLTLAEGVTLEIAVDVGILLEAAAEEEAEEGEQIAFWTPGQQRSSMIRQLSGHEAGQAGGALLSNVLVGQTVIGQTIPGAVSIAEVLVGSSAALTIAIKATNAIINWFFNIFEKK